METAVKKNLSPTYLAYMKSSAWRAVRGRVLQRDGCRCRDCGLVSAHNDVHHLTYARLGCEALDDLITLCRGCHDQRHCTTVAKRVKAPIETRRPTKKKSKGKKRGHRPMEAVKKEIAKRSEARAKATAEYEARMDAMYPTTDWRSW